MNHSKWKGVFNWRTRTVVSIVERRGNTYMYVRRNNRLSRAETTQDACR